MKALVIIPAFNEENNIVATINNLKKVKIKNVVLDYIVINDGSTDNTRDVLIKNNIKFIDLTFNLGIGGAVQTGYKYAYYNNYDIAIQVDGDGQHNPIYIERLISYIKDGYDCVIGSRFLKEDDSFKSTKLRRVGIRFLSNLIKLVTKIRISDPTSGFRAVNKAVIELFSKSYPHDYPEPNTNVLLIKKGFEVKEISVEMNERKTGSSSITTIKSIYYMIKVSLSIVLSSIGDDKK